MSHNKKLALMHLVICFFFELFLIETSNDVFYQE